MSRRRGWKSPTTKKWRDEIAFDIDPEPAADRDYIDAVDEMENTPIGQKLIDGFRYTNED